MSHAIQIISVVAGLTVIGWRILPAFRMRPLVHIGTPSWVHQIPEQHLDWGWVAMGVLVIALRSPAGLSALAAMDLIQSVYHTLMTRSYAPRDYQNDSFYRRRDRMALVFVSGSLITCLLLGFAIGGVSGIATFPMAGWYLGHALWLQAPLERTMKYSPELALSSRLNCAVHIWLAVLYGIALLNLWQG